MMKGFSFMLMGCLLLCACQENKDKVAGREYTGVILGLQYKIETVGDSTDYQEEINAIIHEVSKQFSTLDPNSSLHKFNFCHSTEQPILLDDDKHVFHDFYREMERLHAISQGLVDPTSIALERLSAFSQSMMDAEFSPNIAGTLPAVGFDSSKLELLNDGKNTYLIKHHRDVELDVNNLAACWALDRVVKKLSAHAFTAIKATMAGRTLVYGEGPGLFNQVKLGMTGTENDPVIHLVNRGYASKSLSDKATYVNVKSGMPIQTDVQWVSVSAPSLFASEAFSKMFMSMTISDIAAWYEKNADSDVQSSIFYGSSSHMDRATTEEFDKMFVIKKQ